MHPVSVVSVPIGNLADITERAMQVLREADCVLAEDTRRTGKLLGLLGIHVPELLSYRDQNHARVFPAVLQRVQSGQRLVLVSDSGTPVLSDPGFLLVRDLVDEGVPVTPVPGASALLSALVVSALPPDRFMFLGFFPKKGNERFQALDSARDLKMTAVLYESPNRIDKTLKLLADRYGETVELALCKELTKLHETVLRGTPDQLLSALETVSTKGEWVIVASFRQ
ncbi:MAG: Ribosomal RNA small subunit methyltransferase I [candidate division WS6 bacterium OLB20]|uniref:Ribosomal RNA small subunit methyltransferase I n=1 Tax=candidate division WS6 bacterium OLB20 TaxID=1617426 RepID=A0A136M016_9BACT|nr:MAG: Ribosomal RNA small subunit methyltransferase I [candidate division WS6 bacterium OLB20]